MSAALLYHCINFVSGKIHCHSIFTGIFWMILDFSSFWISFVICYIYLTKYFDVNSVIAIIAGLLIGTYITIQTMNNDVCFGAFYLALPELCARVLRISLVHMLLLFSPLVEVKHNFSMFIESYTCSTKMALEVGKNATSSVASKALNYTETITKALNAISNKFESVISVPVDHITFALNEVGGVLREASKTFQDCSYAVQTVTNDCKTALMEPSRWCDWAVGDVGGFVMQSRKSQKFAKSLSVLKYVLHFARFRNCIRQLGICKTLFRH